MSVSEEMIKGLPEFEGVTYGELADVLNESLRFAKILRETPGGIADLEKLSQGEDLAFYGTIFGFAHILEKLDEKTLPGFNEICQKIGITDVDQGRLLLNHYVLEKEAYLNRQQLQSMQKKGYLV